MAVPDETPKQNTTTTFRCPSRRRISLRRRKLPVLRLGGGDKKARRGYFIVRILKKMRLRWVKLQYSSMLRRLKQYYSNLIKDVIEGGSSFESYQQRLVMEASIAVPVMGFSFAPSMAAYDRPRYL
ncbi:uncharacterized protein [Euphorbia lathyris]|uniref:uncharacterized protein n=1 Tax=Euphorbia lathyris TaxID=212925 RepID=UPI003314493F